VTSELKALSVHVANLCNGESRSKHLLQGCLTAIGEPTGEGHRTFLKTYEASARLEAEAADEAFDSGQQAGALAGLPISIKDLFDVCGERTLAASTVLADAPPASRSSAVVSRLRQAGAVLVGRTNMTEFAYSGVGLNPHYGTPRNPYQRSLGRVPGGSSSGAAVSVTDGMALAAVGSDTGGSIRIPAALCGLTGFKPTARRVPLDGVLPLSPTLDSIGVIAPTVACCAHVDSVLAACTQPDTTPFPLSGLQVGMLQGYVLEGLEKPVAEAYERTLSVLANAGAELVYVRMNALAEIPACNSMGGFAAAESFAWHRELLAEHSDLYDPRVLSRILRGKQISSDDIEALYKARRRIIAEAEKHFLSCATWIMPTVPRIAPLISALEVDDAAYYDANAALLRNPSVFNFLDGCALSLPCHLPGDAPVGLMLAAAGGDDMRLLQIGCAVESVLSRAGCATPGTVNGRRSN
jgi:aspartyl-tRNA(Asn)/glutamyl-tRNA(Gln) amidotransferase subunit A